MRNSGAKSRRRSSGNPSRNRKKALTKQISRVMDDENTTNSEASEHAVFSDINWEENLEVDTTSLLDEFAPQAIPRASNNSAKVPEIPSNVEKVVTEEETISAAKEYELCDVENRSDFHIGLKLLLHNYKTNEWVEGAVEEIDMEEEEILIKYDSSVDNPEEWLSMSSQRIKKKKSIPRPPSTAELVSKVIEKKEIAKPSTPLVLTSAPELVLPSPVVTRAPTSTRTSSVSRPSASRHPSAARPPTAARASSVSKAAPLTRRTSQVAKKKVSTNRMKATISKPPFKKTLALSKKVKQRSKLQQSNRKVSRRLPIWKGHIPIPTVGAASAPSAGPALMCKFSEGEKVLAKWSDHRMQKFPAVIRRVCGGFLYDVLFYDGFEKTIAEDNIYKTTEEEMAKYKECKPSEADSFVDMDIASKHERRQKKRKTFDDFFEEKDLKRKRKVDAYDLNRSESFLRASLSRNKPTLQSFSVHVRKGSLGALRPSLPVSPKASPNSITQDISPAPKPEPLPPVMDSIPSQPSPSSKDKESPLIPEIKSDKIQESFVPPSLPEQSERHPLEITCHDGVVRKSILIEDVKLPSGWTKHVIAWVDNVWACFLFSPDRYAVHSIIELRKYFRMCEGQEPPEGLDFSFPKDSLQDLAEAQKGLVSQADYRKWVNKVLDERKVMKKVRILPPSRTVGPGGHFGTKRIRTLLPRFRSHPFSQGSSVKTLEGKVWRCPKSGCDKKFRKENLLHMHIKHYHVELSELAGKAPNVVDLALARSSADGVFTPEPTLSKRLPQKSPVYDRIPEKGSEITPTVPELSAPDTGASSSHTLGANHTATPLPPTPVPAPSTTGQIVSSSLKVLTPIKQPLDSAEKETLEKTFSEKPRIHTTPRLHLKKYSESKLIDESYMAGSRTFKKKQISIEKTHSADSNDGMPDDVDFKDDSMILERLQSEEIINCICGFKEEDGLMVQCEVCLCWQHGACHGMEKDEDVPERYVCAICLDPKHVRSSQRYSYANHYLTLTKLPRFNYRTCKEDVLRHRERILSKSFELTSNLQSMHRMERALTAKINIAQQKDHPKLYLWSTNWDSPKKRHHPPHPKKINVDHTDKGRRGPVGEEPIESIDCRLRLLDRIEADQQDMESRLTIIQAQLQALESEDFELSGEEREVNGGDPLLKQAVYMLHRDLSTLATATSLS